MQQRVFVVLIARNGEQYLPRTIEGIRANAEAITEIVTVDAASTDQSTTLLGALQPRHALSVSAQASFAESVAVALYALSSEGAEPDDLIWILHDDSAPEPGALAHLVTAFEMGASVAIAGPKLVEWENPRRLSEFGVTVTTGGQKVAIGAGQFDQSQFDDVADVLAVGTAGMLVRRSTLADLAGLDSSLSYGDDGLDLCVRARLTGTRVIRVPEAHVAHASGEGRQAGHGRRGFGAKRRDQWYRRIVYAGGFSAFFLWLTAPIVGIALSIGHVIAKHPGRVAGEIWAAAVTFVTPRKLRRGRQRFRRTKTMPLSSLSTLYQRPAETRAARAAEREREVAKRLEGVDLSGEPQFRYWESRAPWMIAVAVAVSVVLWFPLLSAAALTGGGLAPLSSVPQLWAHAVQNSVDLTSGVTAPADAFTVVLAVLGSMTAWAPSLSIVWVFIMAIPLAAFGGGVAVGHILGTGRAAVVGSVGWMFAPSFLAALSDGRIGAIVAHLCIPFVAYFVSLGFDRRRTTGQSVSAFATASLLAAVVVAAAPSTLIVLVPAWVLLLVARPRFLATTVWIIAPALAVIAPTAVNALNHGEPLRMFADPGIPVAFAVPSRLTLLGGLPHPDALGLSNLAIDMGARGALGLAAPVVVGVIFAILGLWSRRWVVSALGIATFVCCALIAVVIAPVSVVSVAGQSVPVWTGGILSLGWFGLVLAVATASVPERWRGALPATLAVFAIAALALPWALNITSGQGAVTYAATNAVFPAIVDASRSSDPNVRVLTVDRLPGDQVSVALSLTTDGRLDSANTALEGDRTVSSDQEQVAALSAALLTQGTDADTAQQLATFGVRYVLYRSSGSETVADIKALNTNPAITQVASTPFGQLWAVNAPQSIAAPTAEINLIWLFVRGGVLGLFVLLAIPTSRPARQLSRSGEMDPLPIVGGDDDD